MDVYEGHNITNQTPAETLDTADSIATVATQRLLNFDSHGRTTTRSYRWLLLRIYAQSFTKLCCLCLQRDRKDLVSHERNQIAYACNLIKWDDTRTYPHLEHFGL